MKKALAYIFGKWWPTALFTLLMLSILFYASLHELSSLANVSFTLVKVSFVLLLTTLIYQIYRRKLWGSIFASLSLIGCVGIFLLIFAVLIFIDQEKPDTFTEGLTIPDNVQYDNLIEVDFDGNRPDSIEGKTFNENHFQLYRSFQPGLFEYDIWVGEIEPGIVYIKAFEITGNTRLSASSVKERSAIQIENTTESHKRFRTKRHFTIYEGDWYHPYAARFEVWFQPGDGTAERKLLEKNYVIEGWMR